MKKCFRILSVVLAGAMLLSTSALACTGVYVGKDVSDQGTYIIARSEDQAQSDYNKMFMVQPRVENEMCIRDSALRQAGGELDYEQLRPFTRNIYPWDVPDPEYQPLQLSLIHI